MAEQSVGTEWMPCAPGQIQRLLRRHRKRRQRVLATQLAGGAVVGTLLGLMVFGKPPAARHTEHIDDFRFGGMTCTEVRAQGREFMARRLDQETERKIRIHLAECPHCGPLLQRMIPEREVPSGSATESAALFPLQKPRPKSGEPRAGQSSLGKDTPFSVLAAR